MIRNNLLTILAFLYLFSYFLMLICIIPQHNQNWTKIRLTLALRITMSCRIKNPQWEKNRANKNQARWKNWVGFILILYSVSIFGINVSYITGWFLLSGDGTWRGNCPHLWSNPYLGHTGNGPFLCIAFDCMQGWSLDNYICHKRLAARHELLRKALRFGIRSIGFEASNKCNLRETRLHFDRFLLGPKRGG